MNLDNNTSTVTIAGHRFPAVCAICPPHPSDCDPGTDWDRMLGGRQGPGEAGTGIGHMVLIPCENGVLISIEMSDRKSGYEIHLYARNCHQETWNDEFMWMPHYVHIVGGRLVTESDPISYRLLGAPWRWDGAEPEWTAEFIDRISRMPFTPTPGPEVRLIPLAEATALDQQRSSIPHG